MLGNASIGSLDLFFVFFTAITIALLIFFVTIVVVHFISKQMHMRELARVESRLPSSDEVQGSAAFHQSISDVAVGANGLLNWITAFLSLILEELRFLASNSRLLIAAMLITLVGLTLVPYGSEFLTAGNFLYNDVIAVPIRGVFLPTVNYLNLIYSTVVPITNVGSAVTSSALVGNSMNVARCSRNSLAPVFASVSLGLSETARGVIGFATPQSIFDGDLNITDGLHILGLGVSETREVVGCSCSVLSPVADSVLEIFSERSTAVAINSGVNAAISLAQTLPAAVIFERRPDVSRPASHAISALSGFANVTDTILLSTFYRLGRTARGMSVDTQRPQIPVALVVARWFSWQVALANVSLNALAASDEIFDDPGNEEALLNFEPVAEQARLGLDAASDITALLSEDLGNAVRFGGRAVIGYFFGVTQTYVGIAFVTERGESPAQLATYLQSVVWPRYVDPVWADADIAALHIGRLFAEVTPALSGTIGSGSSEQARGSVCSFYVSDPVQTGDLDQAFSGALISSTLRTGIAVGRLASQGAFFINQLVVPAGTGVPHVCSSDWQEGKEQVLNEMRAFVQAVSCSLSQLQASGTPVLIADCRVPGPRPSDEGTVVNGIYTPPCVTQGNNTDNLLGKVVDVFECSGQAVEDFGLSLIDVLEDGWLFAENSILSAEGISPGGIPLCANAGYSSTPAFDLTDALILANDGAEQIGCFAAAFVPDVGVADEQTLNFRKRLPCLFRALFNFITLGLRVLDVFNTGEASSMLGNTNGGTVGVYVNGVALLLEELRDALCQLFYSLGITLNSYSVGGVGAGEIFVDLADIFRDAFTNNVIAEFVDVNQKAIRLGVSFIKISQTDGVIIFASLFSDFVEDLGRIFVSIGFRLFVDSIEALLPGQGHFIATFITKTASAICTVLQPGLTAIIGAIDDISKGAHWLTFGASPRLHLSIDLQCSSIGAGGGDLNTTYAGNMQTNIHARSFCPSIVLPSLANVTEGNSYGLASTIGYQWFFSTDQGEGCQCVENQFSVAVPGEPEPPDYFTMLEEIYPFNNAPQLPGEFVPPVGIRSCRANPGICPQGSVCRGGICIPSCTTDIVCEQWQNAFERELIPSSGASIFATPSVCANGACFLALNTATLTSSLIPTVGVRDPVQANGVCCQCQLDTGADGIQDFSTCALTSTSQTDTVVCIAACEGCFPVGLGAIFSNAISRTCQIPPAPVSGNIDPFICPTAGGCSFPLPVGPLTFPAATQFVTNVENEIGINCPGSNTLGSLAHQCNPRLGGLVYFEGLRLFQAGGLNDAWISQSKNPGASSVMEQFTMCSIRAPENSTQWRQDGFCSGPVVGPTNLGVSSTGFSDSCSVASFVAAACLIDTTPNPQLVDLQPDAFETTQSGPFVIPLTGTGLFAERTLTSCTFYVREEVISQNAEREAYDQFWTDIGLSNASFVQPRARIEWLVDRLPGLFNAEITSSTELPPALASIQTRLASFHECACRPAVDACDVTVGQVGLGAICNDPEFVNGGCNGGPPNSQSQSIAALGVYFGLPLASPPFQSAGSLFCNPILGPTSASDINFNRNILSAFGTSDVDLARGTPNPISCVVSNSAVGDIVERSAFTIDEELQSKRRGFMDFGPLPQRMYDHARNHPLPLPTDGLSLAEIPDFLYDLFRTPTDTGDGPMYAIGTAFSVSDAITQTDECKERYRKIRSAIEDGASRIGVDLSSIGTYDDGRIDLTTIFGKVASPFVVIDALSCMPNMPPAIVPVLADLTIDQWSGESLCDRLVRELAYTEWYDRWPVFSERIAVMECVKARALASIFRSSILVDELSDEFPLELFYSWKAQGLALYHAGRGAVALYMDDSNSSTWTAKHIGAVLESEGIDDKFARAILDFAFEPGRAKRTVNRAVEHLQTVLYSHHFFDEDHSPEQTLGFLLRYGELGERIFTSLSKANIGRSVHALPYGIFRASMDSARMGFSTTSRLTTPFYSEGLGEESLSFSSGRKFVTRHARRAAKATVWAKNKGRSLLTAPFHALSDDPTLRQTLNGEGSSLYVGVNCPLVDIPIATGVVYMSEGYHWWDCALPLIVDNYEAIYFPYYQLTAQTGSSSGTVENTPSGIIDVAARCNRNGAMTVVPSQSDETPLRVVPIGPGIHSLWPFNTHNSSFGSEGERPPNVSNFSRVDDLQIEQGSPEFDVTNANFSAYGYILALGAEAGLELGAGVDTVANFFFDERPLNLTVQNQTRQGGFRLVLQQAFSCEPLSVAGQSPHRISLGRGIVITVTFIFVTILASFFISSLTYLAVLSVLMFFPILFYVTYGMAFTCASSFPPILPLPLGNDAFDLIASIFPACLPISPLLVDNPSAVRLPGCFNPFADAGFRNPCEDTGVIDFIWAFFLGLRWQVPVLFDFFATSDNFLFLLLRNSAYFSNIFTTLSAVPIDPLPANYVVCFVFQMISSFASFFVLGIVLGLFGPRLKLALDGGVVLGTNVWNFSLFTLSGIHDISSRYIESHSSSLPEEERIEFLASIAENTGMAHEDDPGLPENESTELSQLLSSLDS